MTREQQRLLRREWHAGAHLDRCRAFLDRYHTWENEVNLNRAEKRYADACSAQRAHNPKEMAA